MNDIQSALWLVWCIYWLSAAFAGSFIAIILAEIVKAIYRKVKYERSYRKRSR